MNLCFFSRFLAGLVLCEILCDFSLLQSDLFLFLDLPPVVILSLGSFLCVLLYLKEYLWVFLIMKHAFLSHQSGTPWYLHSKTSSMIYSFSTHFHWTIFCTLRDGWLFQFSLQCLLHFWALVEEIIFYYIWESTSLYIYTSNPLIQEEICESFIATHNVHVQLYQQTQQKTSAWTVKERWFYSLIILLATILTWKENMTK